MMHNVQKPVTHKCDICWRSFVSIYNLTKHKQQLHNIDLLKVTGGKTKPKAKENQKPRNHLCNICDKRFLSKNDLRKHIRTHTNERPYVCNVCSAAFKQAVSLKNHIFCKHSVGNAENHVCMYCDKSFPIKDRLRLHLRVHTREQPYKCTECSKTFARGGQLIQHKRTHTKDKPFECNVCNTQFSSGANLRAHLNRHLDVKPFICDICGKAFFRKDGLRKHLDCTHANVRAFHCEICKKNLKGHLPQHMRTHTKKKPHGCAHCGTRFAQRSQLIVHQRIHSGERPYRCQVCWKAFAHSTALKLHIRRHTGEKPFICVVCNAGFSQTPHLKKHVLTIHKSDKPYYCEYCKRFFKTKNDVQTHKDTRCRKKPKIDETKVKIGGNIEPPMSLSKMRLLLAVLLKKISTNDRLNELGFNKRLIDDILVDSITHSGRKPCKIEGISIAERLKKNIQILLNWTIPEQFMEKFKSEQRSTEELLEDLTF